jgi:uncharacterized membrane protein
LTVGLVRSKLGLAVGVVMPLLGFALTWVILVFLSALRCCHINRCLWSKRKGKFLLLCCSFHENWFFIMYKQKSKIPWFSTNGLCIFFFFCIFFSIKSTAIIVQCYLVWTLYHFTFIATLLKEKKISIYHLILMINIYSKPVIISTYLWLKLLFKTIYKVCS